MSAAVAANDLPRREGNRRAAELEKKSNRGDAEYAKKTDFGFHRVLCVSAVLAWLDRLNHRDTENAETQRRVVHLLKCRAKIPSNSSTLR